MAAVLDLLPPAVGSVNVDRFNAEPPAEGDRAVKRTKYSPQGRPARPAHSIVAPADALP